MADRTTFTSSSTPPVTGKEFVDNLAEKLGILFNAMALVPTAISNSGNEYTITIDPELDSDVVSGMLFWITPEVANTGPARLRVTSSNPYYDWVKLDGTAFATGEVEAGTTYGVLFVSGEFRTVTTAASGGAGATIDYQEFTASGSWSKPEDASTDALVFVELWAGGGGGGHSGSTAAGGGGGGGYNFKVLRIADLALTETVTVGAGGAAGSSSNGGVGGTSSFGTHISAFGGGGGVGGGGATNSGGGGGGGQLTAGATGVTSTGGAGGTPLAGAAGASSNTGGGGSTNGNGGGGYFGGGGGAGGQGGSTAGTGGGSVYGGGGGGADTDTAATTAAGGTSMFGGAGGDGQSVATAGGVRGGGGGASSGTSAGAGGRGEVRVWTVG